MTHPLVHAQLLNAIADAEAGPEQLVIAASDILRHEDAYIRNGHLAEYFDLLRRVETAAGYRALLAGGDPSAPEYVCFLALVFEVVRLEGVAANNANFLAVADRLAALNAIDSRLNDAQLALNGLQVSLGDQASNNGFFVINSLAYRYQRHLNSAALARTQGQSSIPSLQELAAIATEYAHAGMLHNAVNVREAVVDELLVYCGSNPDAEIGHRKWLIQTTNQVAHHLATTSYQSTAEEFSRQAQKLAEANFFLGHLLAARQWFGNGIERFAASLAQIHDRAERSLQLQNADDWLGLAVRIEGLQAGQCGTLFREAFAKIYPDISPEIPARSFATVRAHVSRQGSLFQFRAGTVRHARQVSKAHDLFVGLNDLYLAASNDLARYRANATLSSDQSWQDAIDALISQMQLRELSQCGKGVSDLARLLVETQGAGLHFPWMGLLLAAGCRSKSMLIRSLQDTHRERITLPAIDDKVLVLNCFAKSEYLYRRLNYLSGEIVAKKVNCQRVDCHSKEQFIECLSNNSFKLIIIGCHGHQSRLTEPLAISVGEAMIPVLELWENVTLPVASTVILFTCFGGGGQSLATGEFDSQAEMALNAGARAVFASRWPAWMDDNTATQFVRLVAELMRLKAGGSVWDVGAAGVTFANGMKNRSIRDWATWSVYTSGCWIDPPEQQQL